MGIKKFFLNNIGLKLIALVLAVITWIYIVGELDKGTPEDRAALEKLLPYRMTAKIFPIQLNLTGESKEGYEILTDSVTITPRDVMVVGPRSLLSRVAFIKTEPIDISEHTKSISEDVSLMPLAKGLSIKEKFVSVKIPIKKIAE